MESFLIQFNRYFKVPKELAIVFSVISIIGIIIIPLPSVVLDFFLIISLAIGFLTLLISIYIKNPTSLTMFPTLILVVTLFRLALNIATTRTILGEGHNGADSVSQIITAFGNFVVSGNFVIGLIVFIILVLINFMVITKGSTRVAEVSARFTLDSLPGKQMAIDADLNAGFIDDKEAQEKRDGLIQEANFYGAMDGSSKFVKGDAVAGIIITLVNIIGGFMIGVFQHDMEVSSSVQTYTLLTIGDGLVSQIPALLLSTATGILITKSTKDNLNFASGVTRQMSEDYQTFFIVGSMMLLFTLIPGFPTGALLLVGSIFLLVSFFIYKNAKRKGFVLFDKIITFAEGNEFLRSLNETLSEIREDEQTETREQELREQEAVAVEDDSTAQEDELINTNVLELVFGYQLASLTNESALLEKLKGIRKTIANEVGFVIPQIKIRDDNSLRPSEYSLKLKGVELFRNAVETNKLMAIPGFGSEEIEGSVPVKEPIYNMDAFWINQEDKEEAITGNYTVIDIPSLVVTHVMEEIKKQAPEIITRQDIVALLDKVKETHPVIVEDTLTNASYGLVLKIVKELLREKVPMNDLITILEVIADMTEFTKNVDLIVENLRTRLFRVITNVFKSEKDGIIHLMTLEPTTEEYLLGKIQDNNGNTQLLLEIQDIQSLIEKTNAEMSRLNDRGVYPYALIVEPSLRKRLFEIYDRFEIPLAVLGHSEIDPKVPFNIETNISLDLD